MKLHFRETSPSDTPAIAEFLQRIFNGDPSLPITDPQHLHWKCWTPRSEWPGSRGYVMTKGDAIVAHGAVLPMTFEIDGQKVRLVHLYDWAADPKSIGAGVMLLKQIIRLSHMVFVMGGTDMAQKALTGLGFKLHGQATRFALPLHPLKRMAGQPLGLRTGAQVARSLLWSLKSPGASTEGWQSQQVTAETLHSFDIPWPRSGNGPAVALDRSPESVAYFLNCRVTPMEFHVAAQHGKVRGYFMLAHAPSQARIVDLHADSDDPADWAAVASLAVAQARQHDSAAEVVAMASDPVNSQALIACGFHARGDYPLRIFAGPGLQFPDKPLRYQMLDGDGAYLHENKPAFWA